MNAENDILLVYDRQCPACDFYCRHAAIDGRHGRLKLVDARAPSEIMIAITRAGLDIDQGMVLQSQGRLYYGAEAIAELARLAPRRGLFHRASRVFFGTAGRAALLYPAFRAGRNLLLKTLRRSKINNLGVPGNDLF